MRMTTQDSAQVVSGDVEHEQAYAIEFNPFMASLLSDKLYTDKPLACWRELYANAHDESDDIKVRLPDYDDQTCMIWDNGAGLDKDGLIGLFCTYGASNKRDTNSKIGGFGVGSKVLFSYTDTFAAFSVKDGIKTSIICYKNDEGMPTARILGHEPTGEQSGTCIEWAVSAADAPTFRKTALEVFARFKHKPTFVNKDLADYQWPADPYTLNAGAWAIRDGEFSRNLPRTGSGAMIVMGGIAYKLDTTPIGYSYQKLVESHIDIFAPIGAVQLAASREALSYDAKTVAYVKKRLDDVKRDADQMVEDQLAAAPNWYERELMREGVVSPLPFLQDDHREIPEVVPLEVRTWKRTYRNQAPSRLKFDETSSWVLHPHSWDETRSRTKDEWATDPQSSNISHMYQGGHRRRRPHNPYDAVFAFKDGKMPPGFTTRCAAFVSYYPNIHKVLILSEKAHKWLVSNDVPVDNVILWDSAMHEKWKPAKGSPQSRTYAKKEFADVTVNKVIFGRQEYVTLQYAGKLGQFVPPEGDTDTRWFMVSKNDCYSKEDNPGVRGRETELGWLCAAGHLELRTVPKSYARVLGGQFKNINKEADEFNEHVDQLLKENPLIDGLVRSMLHEMYRDELGRSSALDNGVDFLEECSSGLPDWASRFFSIWGMNHFEETAGSSLRPMLNETRALKLAKKELDSFVKKVHKYPMFLPAVCGIRNVKDPDRAITALEDYLNN